MDSDFKISSLKTIQR